MAVASFNNDSPSTRTVSLWGAPNSLKNEITATGSVADIKAPKIKAYIILKLAIQRNISGIGVNQKGSGRFIHLDIAESEVNRPRPHLWSY